jgi:hypothetical protein
MSIVLACRILPRAVDLLTGKSSLTTPRISPAMVKGVTGQIQNPMAFSNSSRRDKCIDVATGAAEK